MFLSIIIDYKKTLFSKLFPFNVHLPLLQIPAKMDLFQENKNVTFFIASVLQPSFFNSIR